MLNRLCSNSQAKKRGLRRTYGYCNGFRWKLFLDPADGAKLKSLPGELAWGTTWELDADSQVGVHVGLPPLRLVARTIEGDPDKVPGILRAAQGRPIVWCEDDTLPERVAQLATQPHLVVRCDPGDGLTDENIEQAREWLEALK